MALNYDQWPAFNTYTTDARDRRVGKSVGGVLTQGFLYGDQLNPIAELDGSSAVVSVFVYGVASNVPDYMVQGSDTYRFVVDHLGSVVAVVDSTTGVIVQQREYDAFGRIVSDTTAPGFSQPFGFAGGLWDADTGMIRFGARDYRPDIGSWVSKDRLRFGGGDTSLYAYAANDPVNLVDLKGLWIDTVRATCFQNIALCSAAGLTSGATIATLARSAGPIARQTLAGGAQVCRSAGELVRILGPRIVKGRPNWKSVTQFGHTFKKHAAGAKNTRSLVDTAASTGIPQGQWLNNQAAANVLSEVGAGATLEQIVRIPAGLGQVILPGGRIVATEWARVVAGSGGIRSAFPVLP